MRGVGIVIALASMAAFVGCGDSASSERDGAGGEKAGHRQKANFALAKLACGDSPKADFAVDSVGLPADSSDRAIATAYASEWPSRDREAAFAGCLKGLEQVPDRFPSSSPSARGIWGRNFLVVSIESEAEDPPVVEPYRVRFWFSSERDHAMSWKARCNSTAANAHFTASRIEAEMTFTTLIGCPPGPGREDAWLERFMESSPEWRLSGENLRLSSDRATVELRGFKNPRKCVIPPSGWIDSGTSKFDCESAINFLTLSVEDRDSYYPGWNCREAELARGRLRFTCWDGAERFSAHGFEPAFYRQRISFEE